MSPAARAAAQRSTVVAFLAAIAFTLAACSGGSDSPENDYSLTITDSWVKAADSGMTAAFGEITNSGDHDVTVVAASSPAATTVELHEVVDDVMRPVDGGFVIPAGETLSLEPGGYHLMFMGVTAPIVAGDDVTITLVLGDGQSVTFTSIAKDFSGANEEYDGEMEMGAEPGMTPSAGMGD